MSVLVIQSKCFTIWFPDTGDHSQVLHFVSADVRNAPWYALVILFKLIEKLCVLLRQDITVFLIKTVWGSSAGLWFYFMYFYSTIASYLQRWVEGEGFTKFDMEKAPFQESLMGILERFKEQLSHDPREVGTARGWGSKQHWTFQGLGLGSR